MKRSMEVRLTYIYTVRRTTRRCVLTHLRRWRPLDAMGFPAMAYADSSPQSLAR